jgi:hypothetical protein
MFRGTFVAGLKRAFCNGHLCLPGALKPLAQDKALRSFLRTLFRQDWVVYAKRPFGGPQHVLHYLARYTHRVAISNHRLVDFTDGKVAFRWNDYAHGNKRRLMAVTAEEFLRRFLLHTLPRGFFRIRSFGFLSNRRRTVRLALCHQLLEANRPLPSRPPATAEHPTHGSWTGPRCGAPMVVIERLTAQQIRRGPAGQRAVIMAGGNPHLAETSISTVQRYLSLPAYGLLPFATAITVYQIVTQSKTANGR